MGMRKTSTPFREGKRGESGSPSVRQQQGRFIRPGESVVWAAAIFLLSAADALLTLGHVSRGASELNPLMAYLLTLGPPVFVAAKICLSLLALAALAAFLPRYRHARACFGTIGALYVAVCCYHVTFFVL